MKGIKIFSAPNKIKLTKEMEEERVKWAIEHENWLNEWHTVAFTDECTIQNFSNLKKKVYTTKNASDSTNFNERAGTTGRFKVNFYGFISFGNRGIYKINGTFNQTQFIDILGVRGALDRMRNSNPPVEYIQQDNLRTHYVNEATELMDTHNFSILPFPRYSPDLAPIENIWAYLKKIVNDKLKFRQANSEDQFWEIVETSFYEIPLSVIQNTINSLPDRCEKCILSCGKNLNC